MPIFFLADNSVLIIVGSVLFIVLVCFGIIFCLYGIYAWRKVAISAKKFDYFIEDLTYKSEMLNSSVDAVVKISNYFDLFEAFTKRNVKDWVKVAARNKDIGYKILDRLRDFANSDDSTVTKKGKK